jgi:hypothetical protein
MGRTRTRRNRFAGLEGVQVADLATATTGHTAN